MDRAYDRDTSQDINTLITAQINLVMNPLLWRYSVKKSVIWDNPSKWGQ